jgi:hypothetical protein
MLPERRLVIEYPGDVIEKLSDEILKKKQP